MVKTQSTVMSMPTLSGVMSEVTNNVPTLSPVSLLKNSPLTRRATVSSQSTLSATQATHGGANALVSVVNRVLSSFAGSTPTTPSGGQPATLVLLAALRRGLSGAVDGLEQSNATTASPALVLNGYYVVPSSPEHVTGWYGKFTYPPAVAGVVQAEQEFDIVDPRTGETVGTFAAVVSHTNSLIFGGSYQQLLVTADLAGTVGTDAGDTPPVGSVISTYEYGRFGAFYSAMPTPSGDTMISSYKFVRPFVVIPGHVTFNAAAGLADHSVDNKPIQLTEDYYIVPQDPSGENFTAITGPLPLAVAVQGSQIFDVYQKSEEGNDVLIGSFEGYFTSTSDKGSNSTEAILVTKVVEGPVGTRPGDVPPVGSVYNVGHNESKDIGFVYSAIPSPSGDVISFTITTRFGTAHIPIHFDAATPPPSQSLSVPGGYSLVPASTLQPTGINGIPPREVQIQGNQEFDVYNSVGAKIGSFDAVVTTQWDILGNRSVGVLVTGATAGTGAVNFPPVGSKFNIFYVGNSDFAVSYSTIPSSSGVVKSVKLVTPFNDSPMPV